MGSLLVVSIAAMTSIMTLIQLILLAVTLPVSPAPKADQGAPAAGIVAAKNDKKVEEKANSHKTAARRTRRHRAHRAHAHNAPSKA